MVFGEKLHQVAYRLRPFRQYVFIGCCRGSGSSNGFDCRNFSDLQTNQFVRAGRFVSSDAAWHCLTDERESYCVVVNALSEGVMAGPDGIAFGGDFVAANGTMKTQRAVRHGNWILIN